MKSAGMTDNAKAMVNKMTNWQRTQWAKAGYPIKEALVHIYVTYKTPEGIKAAVEAYQKAKEAE